MERGNIMSLFGKKKENEYVQASQEINKEVQPKTAAERLVMENLVDPDKAVSLADMLMKGSPICIGCGELDVDEANKIIAFLSGVVYAIGGEVRQINDKAFLFARKQEFMDGTLNQFLAQLS